MFREYVRCVVSAQHFVVAQPPNQVGFLNPQRLRTQVAHLAYAARLRYAEGSVGIRVHFLIGAGADAHFSSQGGSYVPGIGCYRQALCRGGHHCV